MAKPWQNSIRPGWYSEQARNEAFAYVKFNKRQKEVFEVIKQYGPISIDRIAAILNRYPHTISPRVLELRDAGMIEFAGYDTSSISGRKVSLWKISQGVQLKLEFK